MSIVQHMESAAAATREIVAGVKPEQLTSQTPCAEWDTRALLNHIIGAMGASTAAALGGKGRPPGDEDRIGSDALAAYDQASEALFKAWSDPSLLEKTVDFSVGEMPGSIAAQITLMELAVHGWDLARATGQTIALDEATTAAVEEAVRSIIRPRFRQPGVFDEEKPATGATTGIERAAAFTGRAI